MAMFDFETEVIVMLVLFVEIKLEVKLMGTAPDTSVAFHTGQVEFTVIG